MNYPIQTFRTLVGETQRELNKLPEDDLKREFELEFTRRTSTSDPTESDLEALEALKKNIISWQED